MSALRSAGAAETAGTAAAAPDEPPPPMVAGRPGTGLAAAAILAATGLTLALLAPQRIGRPIAAGAPGWATTAPEAAAGGSAQTAAADEAAGGTPGHAGEEVAADADPAVALRHGNRLLREGDPAAAMRVWEAGWRAGSPSGDRDVLSLLAYNLGTTAHRLDRRPAAVLWYRRSATAGHGDLWLSDNLELVRAELAAPRLAPTGAVGFLATHRETLLVAGVALAWAAALGWVLAGRGARPTDGSTPTARFLRSVGLCGAAAILALACWAGAVALATWGPRPAVLLTSCPPAVDEPSPAAPGAAADSASPGTHLAAGSEVWVRPAPGDRWRVSGAAGADGAGPIDCPAGAIGLVE